MARRRQLALGLVPLTLFALGACAVETDDRVAPTERVDSVEQPIEGGYVDSSTTHVVGLVRLGNNSLGTCSGTLIAPNVVLTAQHCVAESSDGGAVICESTVFYNAFSADSFYVTTRTSLTQNPADYYRVAEVIVPPDSRDFCNNDQAILILDTPIPATEATPAVPRVDTPLEPDEVYDIVGYGQTGPSGNSGTRYRRDGLVTQCVGLPCTFASGVREREWLGDEGACQGDSGGPAFDALQRVVGVLSRGSQGTCDFPIYGHVFGWGQWIKDTTAYGTSSRGLEVPSWAQGFPTDPVYSAPVGAACAGPSQCLASNACVDGYCTRPCLPEAPCPDGYVCREDGFCALPPPPPASADDDDDGGTRVSAGCSLGGGKDPTKPIPWVIAPIALFFGLRRRRRG